MKRMATVVTLAMGLLGSILAGTALGQTYGSPGGYDSEREFRRDDSNQAFRWGQHRFDRANFEGRWVADNRSADFDSDRGTFRGGRGMRGLMLPDFIRIDQRPRMVRIADARHRLVQEILIDRRFDPRNDSEQLIGHWRGRTLVVERTGPRGALITQTMSLENRGRTLVIRTRREGGPGRGWGSGRTVEFTNTYHRA